MIDFSRPLLFFDTETTGTDMIKDRIVSLAVRKYKSQFEHEDRKILLNPGIPIPASATAVHGITDEMVADAPPFRRIAKALYEFMHGSNICGYNTNQFDIPLLAEEFMRVGLVFPDWGPLCFDGMQIFKKKEERNLTAAMKFYCGEEMPNAHDAYADTIASAKVFFQQLKHYPDLGEMNNEALAEFCRYDNRIDLGGWFMKDEEGDAIYGKGKHIKEKVKSQLGFCDWMLKQAFITEHTKWVTRNLLEYYRQ